MLRCRHVLAPPTRLQDSQRCRLSDGADARLLPADSHTWHPITSVELLSGRASVARLVCLILGVVLPTMGTSLRVIAQDSFLERWNLHDNAEGADIGLKRAVNPTRFQERRVADDFAREESSRSGVPGEFDLAEFTEDFGDAPRESGRTIGVLGQPSSENQDSDSSDIDSADPFDARTVSDEVLSDFPHEPALDPDSVFSDGPRANVRSQQWQILPQGLLYKSYLAGEKEPRMQFMHLYDTRNKQTYWEAVLGGRVGLFRNGTVGAANPEGFQIDLEGAVFARVLPTEPSAELAASDYRAGLLATWRQDGTAWKAGYYHISSHVGDEFLIANPTFNRINYVRDSLILGTVRDLSPSSRVYGEIGYALGSQGGAEPLELQYGVEYTPIARSSLRGAPFAAANGHIREEFDFRSGFNFVSGWGWQGQQTGHRLRVGLQYYTGPSLQYQFFDRLENLVGGGIWFDY